MNIVVTIRVDRASDPVDAAELARGGAAWELMEHGVVVRGSSATTEG